MKELIEKDVALNVLEICGYKKAASLISELPPVDGDWIPCSERMPEPDREVLVATYGSDMVFCQKGEDVIDAIRRQNREIKNVTLAFVSIDDGCWYSSDYMPLIVHPTYWKPKPEAPDYPKEAMK